MKLLTTILAICAIPLSNALTTDSATISIQLTDSTLPPISLVSINYNPSTLEASVDLSTYELPSLPESSAPLRIGIYDAASATWKSSTSVTSAESFAKGYRPTFVLSLDAQGQVLSVACKSARVDAGSTRDFGLGVKVVRMGKGVQPSLNRPVVLSTEGKVAQPVVEKTMLQKYWWVLLAGVFLLMTTGGGEA